MSDVEQKLADLRVEVAMLRERVSRLETNSMWARSYFTTLDLARYLGYRGKTVRGQLNAATGWAKRTGIPKYWRGKCWVYRPSDVDRILEGHDPRRLKRLRSASS